MNLGRLLLLTIAKADDAVCSDGVCADEGLSLLQLRGKAKTDEGVIDTEPLDLHEYSDEDLEENNLALQTQAVHIKLGAASHMNRTAAREYVLVKENTRGYDAGYIYSTIKYCKRNTNVAHPKKLFGAGKGGKGFRGRMLTWVYWDTPQDNPVGEGPLNVWKATGGTDVSGKDEQHCWNQYNRERRAVEHVCSFADAQSTCCDGWNGCGVTGSYCKGRRQGGTGYCGRDVPGVAKNCNRCSSNFFAPYDEDPIPHCKTYCDNIPGCTGFNAGKVRRFGGPQPGYPRSREPQPVCYLFTGDHIQEAADASGWSIYAAKDAEVTCCGPTPPPTPKPTVPEVEPSEGTADIFGDDEVDGDIIDGSPETEGIVHDGGAGESTNTASGAVATATTETETTADTETTAETETTETTETETATTAATGTTETETETTAETATTATRVGEEDDDED